MPKLPYIFDYFQEGEELKLKTKLLYFLEGPQHLVGI